MDEPGLDEQTFFYIGQHETRRDVPVTDLVLQQARDCGYDMLTTPISTPHLHAEVWKLLTTYFQELEGGIAADELPPPLLPPFNPIESYLTPGDSVGQLLAFTSPWIDLASPDPIIANLSRQIINQEIAYAAFCGVGNVVVHGPRLYRGRVRDQGIAQYARAIQEAIAQGPYIQVYLRMPVAAELEDVATGEVGHLAPLARAEYRDATHDESRDADLFLAWDAWNIIRSTCKYTPRLSLALDLPAHLPPLPLQARWYSEPVRLLTIPGTSFLLNKRKQPVLSRTHQSLVSRFMRLKQPPWILLTDVGPIPGLDSPDVLISTATGYMPSEQAADASSIAYPTPAEAAQVHEGLKDPLPHLSYLRYLQRHQPPKSIIERFGAGYQDYLQAPLQPLTDNLESITYEVFEKDPIKYEWYERAITQALKDWVTEEKPSSSIDGAVVVAVVGAGRGPLVTRALNASAISGVPIELFAVEKNPNAYVLLQRHNEVDWARRVTVVKSDMRSWKGPARSDGSFGRVDILISELLGSFGDNELSPECLDGVQHVLNPYCGISIPTSYTAHLTPIAAPKLHSEILGRTQTDASAPETPHVVMLHAIDYLCVRSPSRILHADERTDTAHPASSLSPPAKDRRHTISTPTPNLETHPPIPQVETCWSFSHPLPSRILAHSHLRKGGGLSGGGGGATGGDGANEHNARFWRGRFPCKNRGTCHGLAGYFETVLYEGLNAWSATEDGATSAGASAGASTEQSLNGGTRIELSTNPETMDAKSRDMISWFPIFFPLKVPLYIPDDSELQVSMWRQTDDRKVWYEWMVESFAIVGGQRIRLGATDLHSSRKNGCLM